METVCIATETEWKYAKMEKKDGMHFRQRRRYYRQNMNQVIIILEKVPIPLYFFIHLSFFWLSVVRLFGIYLSIG